MQVLSGFKSSKIMLLVATDVAARGLDVKDITHVINYDFPMQKGTPLDSRKANNVRALSANQRKAPF